MCEREPIDVIRIVAGLAGGKVDVNTVFCSPAYILRSLVHHSIFLPQEYEQHLLSDGELGQIPSRVT
jgi:hypothetical protein